MQIERADFELLADSPIPELAVRVTIRGEGLEQRALPIVARVGDQTLLALAPTVTFPGVQGFLAAEPTLGDELRIGFLDQELVPTGITYDGPVS